jgi:hypothetical protein
MLPSEPITENSPRRRTICIPILILTKYQLLELLPRENRGKSLRRKVIKALLLLRCLIRPSLRHEKQRSFLFSRVDLLNRTDPGEVVRNVEYML